MEATEVKTNGQATLADRVFGMASDFAEIAQLVQAASLPTARQQFVQSLGIAELLAGLNNINVRIGEVARGQNAANATVNRIKREIEEVKSLKIVNGEIEGKNEAERAARMTALLRTDSDFQGLRGQLETMESSIADMGVELELLRARGTAIKYEIRFKTAQLEYLAE